MKERANEEEIKKDVKELANEILEKNKKGRKIMNDGYR